MNCKWLIIKWAQLGSNQRPPDYECSFFELIFGPNKSQKLKYLKQLQDFML